MAGLAAADPDGGAGDEQQLVNLKLFDFLPAVMNIVDEVIDEELEALRRAGVVALGGERTQRRRAGHDAARRGTTRLSVLLAPEEPWEVEAFGTSETCCFPSSSSMSGAR